MDASVNNGICRCCASEGTFKVLTGTYQWMGEEEVYADMLKECFDIKLTCSEDNREGGICEVCITQLRNASNFKKQVLYTENQLKNRLQDNLFRNSIKVEVPGPDEAVDSDNDNNASDDFSGPEFEVPIKVEVPEESKPKKRMTRAVGSRSKKAKTEHGESSTKQQEKISLDVKTNFSTMISIDPWGGENREPKSRKKRSRFIEPDFIDPDQSGKESPQFEESPFLDFDQKGTNPEENVEKPRKSKKKKSVTKITVDESSLNNKTRLAELDLHIDNVKTILKTSNITPVRYKNGEKYGCSYCKKEYIDPRDLKCHSIEKHVDGKPACFKIKQLSKFLAFLDTTSLMCKLCLAKLINVDDFTEHLKDVHETIIHPNIKTQIVPFKYNDGEIKCDGCDLPCKDFEVLEQHVATHTKNYVCSFCEEAFIVKQKMVEHKKDVHQV